MPDPTLSPELESIIAEHAEGPWGSASERAYVPETRAASDLVAATPPADEAAAEPAPPAEEAKTPPAEEAKQEPAAEEPKVAKSLAVLARKEAALHKREREMKATIDSLAEKIKAFEAERQAFDAVRTKEYEDPVALLAAHGFSVDHAVAAKLRADGTELPPEVSAKVDAELSDRKRSREQTAAEKRIADLEARIAAREEAEAKARAEAELAQQLTATERAKSAATDYILAHAEQFPAAAEAIEVYGFDVASAMVELYRQTMNETGKALALSEAAAYYEKEWQERRNRKRPQASQTTTPPVENQPPARDKPKRPTSSTLANQDSADRATRRALTPQEEFEADRRAALQMMRDGIKS